MVFPSEIKVFTCGFDGPFTSHCHLDSWAPKHLGPRGHCPPAPPLVGPVPTTTPHTNIAKSGVEERNEMRKQEVRKTNNR